MEALSVEYTKLQNSLNDLILARQKLEAQYQENKIVLDEFEQVKKNKESGKLKELPKIYKQTGSILLPVTLETSESNVSKRIEFINNEIKRVEKKLQDTNQELDSKRNALIQLQSAAASAPQA